VPAERTGGRLDEVRADDADDADFRGEAAGRRVAATHRRADFPPVAGTRPPAAPAPRGRGTSRGATAATCDGDGAGTTTTGTRDRCTKNGVVPAVPSAATRRVAVPALIAASVGSDVSATSRATVIVQRSRTCAPHSRQHRPSAQLPPIHNVWSSAKFRSRREAPD
jgi:hypothetical protein